MITGVSSDNESEEDNSTDTSSHQEENDNWTIVSEDNDRENIDEEENDDDMDIQSLRQELEQAQQEFEDLVSSSEDEDEEINDPGIENDEIGIPNQTTRSGREVRPPTNYQPDFENQCYNTTMVTYGNKDEVNDMIVASTLEVVMIQYSLGKGLKKFGDQGSNAIYDELNQMHKRGAFEPKHYSELTRDEQSKVLDTIVLIEEKRWWYQGTSSCRWKSTTTTH